eukprot:3413354-Prymnesium_polylepis.1
MHSTGAGGPLNVEVARRLLQLAAAQGSPPAKRALDGRPQAEEQAEKAKFQVGTRVKLRGLAKKPELNGANG